MCDERHEYTRMLNRYVKGALLYYDSKRVYKQIVQRGWSPWVQRSPFLSETEKPGQEKSRARWSSGVLLRKWEISMRPFTNVTFMTECPRPKPVLIKRRLIDRIRRQRMFSETKTELFDINSKCQIGNEAAKCCHDGFKKKVLNNDCERLGTFEHE